MILYGCEGGCRCSTELLLFYLGFPGFQLFLSHNIGHQELFSFCDEKRWMFKCQRNLGAERDVPHRIFSDFKISQDG